jgi:hypothetical protein
VRDSVTLGRGGIAYRADVRIDASVDVSREACRIRRDPRHGTFFIVDLSTLGTTVNGVKLPKGYEDGDGTKRENGVETPLASGSRIGLADTIYLGLRRPAPMTWLLWGRFVVLAALGAVTVALAWGAMTNRG